MRTIDKTIIKDSKKWLATGIPLRMIMGLTSACIVHNYFPLPEEDKEFFKSKCEEIIEQKISIDLTDMSNVMIAVLSDRHDEVADEGARLQAHGIPMENVLRKKV